MTSTTRDDLTALIERSLPQADHDTVGIASRASVTLLQGIASEPFKPDPTFTQSTDIELLVKVVERIIANQPMALSEHAQMQFEGMVAFRRLLDQHGGLYTVAQTAQLLGISEDAVRKRVSAGKLISVSLGNRHVYPVWQFDSSGVVPHFEKILRLLDTRSAVAHCRFFLSADPDFNRTRIEVLRSHPDPETLTLLERKARQFNQHTAA